MKTQKAYKIPTTLQKVKMQVESGEMTLNEAAVTLCRAGFTNFVDEKLTQEFINETKI